MEKLTGKAGPSQFCVVWIQLLVYKMSDVLEATTRQEKFMLLFVIVLIICETVCSLLLKSYYLCLGLE